MANEHAAIHNDLIHPCDEVLDRGRSRFGLVFDYTLSSILAQFTQTECSDAGFMHRDRIFSLQTRIMVFLEEQSCQKQGIPRL